MLEVFVIYDSAGQYYQHPFVAINKGVALREFSDACNNKDTFLAKHPADYTLFHLGSFSESDGRFELFPTPMSLGVAQEYVRNVVQPKAEFVKDDVN